MKYQFLKNHQLETFKFSYQVTSDAKTFPSQKNPFETYFCMSSKYDSLLKYFNSKQNNPK